MNTDVKVWVNMCRYISMKYEYEYISMNMCRYISMKYEYEYMSMNMCRYEI